MKTKVDDGGSVRTFLTMRDYFAAKAMQGLTSGTEWDFEPAGPMPIQVVTDLALSSYQIADALLKARSA